MDDRTYSKLLADVVGKRLRPFCRMVLKSHDRPSRKTQAGKSLQDVDNVVYRYANPNTKIQYLRSRIGPNLATQQFAGTGLLNPPPAFGIRAAGFRMDETDRLFSSIYDVVLVMAVGLALRVELHRMSTIRTGCRGRDHHDTIRLPGQPTKPPRVTHRSTSFNFLLLLQLVWLGLFIELRVVC